MWLRLTRVCVHILMLILNICIRICCGAKTRSLIKQWCCTCWHWVPLLWTVIKKTVLLGTTAYERTIHLKWFPWIPAFLEDFITQTISACIKLPLQLKVSCFYKNWIRMQEILLSETTVAVRPEYLFLYPRTMSFYKKRQKYSWCFFGSH